MALKLAEFIDQLASAAEQEARKRSGCTSADEREIKRLKSTFKAPFLKPERKPLLNILVVREWVNPERLVVDIAEQIDNLGTQIYLSLDAGELNHEGLLTNGMLAFMHAFWIRAVKIYQTPNGLAEPLLAQDIDAVLRAQATLRPDDQGHFAVEDEDKKNLREALSDSIIDPDAFWKTVRVAPPPGQVL